MDQPGGRLHVVHVAGLVVDVGQQHHRGVLVDGRRQLFRAVHQAQGVPLLQQLRQAFDYVQVGRKVAAFGDDHPPQGRTSGLDLQGGAEDLEQVDGSGIGDDHLTSTRTDQRRQPIPQALGQVTPAGRVPAADQALAPLLLDHLPGPLGSRHGAGTKGVAIEVDHPFGQAELLAQRRQGVLFIETQAVVFIDHWQSCLGQCHAPVSYTHLTLPTIYSV